MNMNRREFFSKSGIGIGSVMLALQFDSPLFGMNLQSIASIPFGFQVWTIKDALIKDFSGTLKMMAGLGYKTVEMCSPPGYETSGFGPLMKLKGAEMKKIVEDAGLRLESTHYGMGELRENLDNRIAFAAESGQKQMICSSFWLPESATISDWQKAAEELNKIGEKTKASGIQMGFHNHHMEFQKLEGKLIYDLLLENLDKDLVKMQFQVAVVNIGYKASDYFEKYPGRFISAHLSDWSATSQKQVPIGQGIVDWNEFFAAAQKAGVKNYFEEMDQETFKDSAVFLQKI